MKMEKQIQSGDDACDGRIGLTAYRMRCAAFLIVALAAAWGFLGMFEGLRIAFVAAEEDLSYGWYVPIFSLYLLWKDRSVLRNAARAAKGFGWGGLLLCVPAAALALLGTRGLQLRFEILAFVLFCVGIPWIFFGWQCARRLLFPAAFLLFMMPVASFLAGFTIHLRYLAVGTALTVLHGIGVEATRIGTALVAGGPHPFSIDVAEPCSGLRSLFALMALTAGYAYLTLRTFRGRTLLFLASVPLAICGNVMRILSICLIATAANAAFATGFYHDYSGYIVFIVAIALMVAIGDLLARWEARKEVRRAEGEVRRAARGVRSDGGEIEKSKNRKIEKSKNSFTVLVPHFLSAVLLATLFVFQGMTPAAEITRAPDVVPPAKLLGAEKIQLRYCQSDRCGRLWELPELTGTNCPACGAAVDAISLGEHTILPADTIIRKGRYEMPSGETYDISFVLGGISKSSIHRPELCLPSQGFEMRSPEDRTVCGRPWRVMRIVAPYNGPVANFAYTFFNQAGYRTHSHTARIFRDVLDRSLLNRIDRWVMVTVNGSGGDADFTRVLEALSSSLPQ